MARATDIPFVIILRENSKKCSPSYLPVGIFPPRKGGKNQAVSFHEHQHAELKQGLLKLRILCFFE
jgi:hypothetical protein